jgi:hypothetical protein
MADLRELVERWNSLPVPMEAKRVYAAKSKGENNMHWTKTPEGRKKLSKIQRARWAKHRNGAVNGRTLVAIEYQNGDGQVRKVYMRRKDDPKTWMEAP